MSLLTLEHDALRGDLWFRRAGELLDELEQIKLQRAQQQEALNSALQKIASVSARCELLEQQLNTEREARMRASCDAREKEKLVTALSEVQKARESAENARENAERQLQDVKSLHEQLKSNEELLRSDLLQRVQELDATKVELLHVKTAHAEAEQRLRDKSARADQLEQQCDALRRELREARTQVVRVAPGSVQERPTSFSPTCDVTRSFGDLDGVSERERESLRHELQMCRAALNEQRTLSTELRRLVEEVRLTTIAEAEDAFSNRVGVLQASMDDLLGALDARTHMLLVRMRGQLGACQVAAHQTPCCTAHLPRCVWSATVPPSSSLLEWSN